MEVIWYQSISQVQCDIEYVVRLATSCGCLCLCFSNIPNTFTYQTRNPASITRKGPRGRRPLIYFQTSCLTRTFQRARGRGPFGERHASHNIPSTNTRSVQLTHACYRRVTQFVAENTPTHRKVWCVKVARDATRTTRQRERRSSEGVTGERAALPWSRAYRTCSNVATMMCKSDARVRTTDTMSEAI